MKPIVRFALLTLVILLLAACQPVAVTPQVVTATPEPGAPEAATPEVAVLSLAGTSWRLATLSGQLPLSDPPVTLEFGEDGAAFGSDGCNRFATKFVQDGASLTIAQPMASTMMACSEAVMNQASAFTTALGQTTSFVGDPQQLILRADNQILATFVAVSQDLADTAWDVISYNNGRDAVVGLLLGTEISANFSAGGELTGNAGCNEYFTDYQVNGNNIAIGLPGQTMRLCPEPAGVMEQEAEYLAALQSAATYSIEGDTLQMRTAADQLAVFMVRKVIVDLPAPEPEPEVAPEATPEPATPTARVTGSQGVNVRAGPGVNFPVLGVARFGDEGEIIGRNDNGTWWAVALPSAPNGVGWVSADLVIATHAQNVPVIASPPPPTVAPTAVPPTRVPTAIPPTAAPQPTATPAPEISFWADRTSINQGECVTLNWSVNNVQAVWVYPVGQPFDRFPRTGQGNEVVCPTTSTTYEMRVLLRDGSTIFRQVAIAVAIPAPTATPVPAPDTLAGTRWDVVNISTGQGIVTLLPGTNGRLDFGTDGQVNGSAGCNTYFGPYRVNGNNITIGPLAGTSRVCTEPEGIMDQDAQVLTALQSAATHRINVSNQLELLNAGGQIVVIANRAP